MEHLTIQFHHEEDMHHGCALCEKPIGPRRGPHLILVDRPGKVCRHCGQRLAPRLVALLDLAQVAEKVGRTCRHILVPPMESLLDLAHAAENYTCATPRVKVTG